MFVHPMWWVDPCGWVVVVRLPSLDHLQIVSFGATLGPEGFYLQVSEFLIDDFGPCKRHRVCPYRVNYFKEFSPGQGRYFREHGEVPLTFLKHYTTLTK